MHGKGPRVVFESEFSRLPLRALLRLKAVLNQSLEPDDVSAAFWPQDYVNVQMPASVSTNGAK